MDENVHKTDIQAKVILAKCPYTYSKNDNLFGIRIQKFGTDWKRTWAFKIDVKRAHNEGYDKEHTSGTFEPTVEYPGCPYCKSFNLAQCVCGNTFCLKLESENIVSSLRLTCPWCGQTNEFSFAETLNLQGGGY